MKPVNVGWVKGKTYTVNMRILAAAPADAQAAESALQSDFDLGGRTHHHPGQVAGVRRLSSSSMAAGPRSRSV